MEKSIQCAFFLRALERHLEIELLSWLEIEMFVLERSGVEVPQNFGARTQTPWSPTHTHTHNTSGRDFIMHRLGTIFVLPLAATISSFHSLTVSFCLSFHPSLCLLLFLSLSFFLVSLPFTYFDTLLQANFMCYKWPLSCLHGWLHHNANLHYSHDGGECVHAISRLTNAELWLNTFEQSTMPSQSRPKWWNIKNQEIEQAVMGNSNSGMKTPMNSASHVQSLPCESFFVWYWSVIITL